MATQAGPSSPKLPIPESCTRNHYILKRRGSGVFGEIYTSIPKDSADRILAEYKRTPKSKIKTLSKLRAELQAVKVTTIPCEGDFRTRTGDDLDLELKVLQKFRDRASSPHIVSLLDTDPLPQCKMWCTLELLTAGSLDDLFAQYTAPTPTIPRCPEAFVWHILYQLSCAFLLLHFGIRGDDVRPDASLPRCYHHDIHRGNILIRSPEASKSTSASFKDYPDIVICDFGQAQEIPPSTAPANDRAMGLHQQIKDLQNALVSLESIARHCTDAAENQRMDWLWDGFLHELTSDTDDSGVNDWLMKKLLFLRKRADHYRKELYVPMPQGVSQWLAREAVSDAEFEDVFEQLRS